MSVTGPPNTCTAESIASNPVQIQEIWANQFQQMQYLRQIQAAIFQSFANDTITNRSNNNMFNANQFGNPHVIFPNLPTDIKPPEGISQTPLPLGFAPNRAIELPSGAGIDPASIQMTSMNMMGTGPRPPLAGPYTCNPIGLPG